MNYVDILIPFVGGLGMFIYGMQIMAQGLENAAGSKMKSLLEVLTKNKLMGVLLGAAITAVIQSSSATTVMVVGFVNAGIMNLTQAMGVIMGANVGTTVTGWLVSSVEWAEFLSPEQASTDRSDYRCGYHVDRQETYIQRDRQYYCWFWFTFYRYFYDVISSRAAERI